MASDSVGEIEIPIWVKGTQKWVTGLTKRTTCDDVIYALLYQDGLHEHSNTSAYAVFEKWREVERPLQGRTKIVKIWRTWGAEQTNVVLSMRRIDELEYSGEFSLTRRKRRSSRHRTRERERERERSERRSRDRNHHSYCQNASERLRSMETLVKLVISQERKLKDMLEHGDDTDKLIDKYESKVHAHRLKQDGEEYPKDSYLATSTDNMDEMFSNANVEDLEIYVSFCDKIIELEDRIKSEHSKIEDLSYQIQTLANERDSNNSGHATVSRRPSNTEDIAKVQVDLNRAVSCAIMQQYKYQDLQRELQFYDDKVQHKEDICRRLEQELDELNTSYARSNDSMDSVGSSGKSNPLPLPERRHRAPTDKPPVAQPPPLPERSRPRTEFSNDINQMHPRVPNDSDPRPFEQPNRIPPPAYRIEQVPERKPILKTSQSGSDLKNSYDTQGQGHCKTGSNSETKVRFKTDDLIDKYYWEESSLSEGISIDHSDCSDSKDLFDYRKEEYSHIKSGYADKPYLTVKVEDPDSNSDTGLSSMHSDDSAVYHLETLV